MAPQPSLFPQNPSRKFVRDDQEFEWLICLASTYQACQRQRAVETVETRRPSRPRVLARAVSAWTLEVWRRVGPKNRKVA